ncbi:MAG TPA: MMPL family transporter [Verrucomicrobiae bacterium]|nr:MMPL family transporter [Verrucomicrobiae bacterium]
MHQRLLSRLSNFVCRRPLAILLAGVLLAAISALYAVRRLEFKTSQNDLIGRDSAYWRLYDKYAREFHSEEDYIILVESDQPGQNRAAIDALVSRLLSPANNPAPGDSPLAQKFTTDDLFYRTDINALKKWFLYYLSIDDLKQIEGSLKDFKQLLDILQHRAKLDTFFDAMNRMLMQMETATEAERKQIEAFLPTVTAIVNQMGTFNGQGPGDALLSPWASAFFSPDMLRDAQDELQFQGYQTFRKGHMFLLLVHPRLGTETADEHHAATIPKLRRIMDEVRGQFPNVKVNLTGEPVLDYDEMIQSQRDATKATMVTLVLICLLFVVGFRSVLRPLMGVICMVLVLAVCVGYTTLTVGHLNMITVTFAVMILGLGIDLGIQFIARYEEELSEGATRPDAVRGAVSHTGPSIITAGVTNAAAFFAMGLSGFRGVIELGIIAGGGMLIATVGTMTVLPSLLLLIHRKQEAKQIPAQAVATRVERLLLNHRYVMLGVFGVITLAALVAARNVRFDYNVLDLQSKGLASVETELRLLHADVESTLFAAVVCDNLQQTRDLQERLSKLPSVASVHSIAELIPEQQEQKAAIIRNIQRELGAIQFDIPPTDSSDAELDVRSLRSLGLRASQLLRRATEQGDTAAAAVLKPLVDATLQTRATLEGLAPDDLEQRLAKYEQRFYADLQAQLRIMSDQIVDRPMRVADVPPELRQIMVGRTGKFLIRVFPKENIWERAPLVRFVHEVESVAPNATGTPMGLYEFVEILKTGYCKAALWALLVIAILIFIDFRGGYATVLTILPLLVGTAWMLGAMVLFRIDFNPANIMVLPLIVGIGVAYGIYVVQRYRESHEATFYSKSTGRAVILSAFTTTFAFASLLIGAHRGIRSLGLVTTLGVISCLLAALVLLPSLLEIARRKGWKV